MLEEQVDIAKTKEETRPNNQETSEAKRALPNLDIHDVQLHREL